MTFASDATGTFSSDTCMLEPRSDTEASCDVRYTPSGSVPADGRQDRLTAKYVPADTDTWMASAGEATVAVRGQPTRPNSPSTPAAPSGPQSATELALACSPARLVLLSAWLSRNRVRFRGAAAPADAGQRVTVRTLRRGAVAAHARVRPDGSFEATGRAPGRRAMNKTRYYVELGERRCAGAEAHPPVDGSDHREREDDHYPRPRLAAARHTGPARRHQASDGLRLRHRRRRASAAERARALPHKPPEDGRPGALPRADTDSHPPRGRRDVQRPSHSRSEQTRHPQPQVLDPPLREVVISPLRRTRWSRPVSANSGVSWPIREMGGASSPNRKRCRSERTGVQRPRAAASGMHRLTTSPG